MKRIRFFSILALFLMVTLTGITYLLFLQFIFPGLVPSYGAGEPFTLNTYNNYTYQIPWYANTRTHLSLKTDNTVELYSNCEYLGNVTSYKFIIEPQNTILVLMKSNSPVSGRFTAWQEIPPEKQTLGFIIVLIGVAGIGSIICINKKI